jgi:hypothetical protein
MRAVIAVALLWATPAHANWQYTKWGMTPEQVIEASGGTVSKTPEDQQKARGRFGFVELLSGTYTSEDFHFKVDFQFSKNKLEMIGMVPTESDRCKRLQSALTSKYGLPWENRSDRYGPHLIWQDRAHGNTIRFSDVPSASWCLILYDRLEMAGAKGL